MPENPMSGRETWAIRVALGLFVFFTVLGIILLYFPSDLLTNIFAILLLVTLGAGVLLGILTVYSS